MANRYWVGGSGTWNTTSTTNWSASSGGAGGASVPTAADSVFFDQAGTYTVTCTGALKCLDITVSAGVVTFADGTSPTFEISGSLTLLAGTVWSSTGTITLNSTTTGKTVTTNGVSISGAIIFNGSGGAWTLGSALTTLSNLTITAGTLNTSASNYAITTTSLSVDGTLTLNASTVSISGNFSVTGTINSGTSQINISSLSPNFTSSNVTYYNVSFTSTTLVNVYFRSYSPNTFNNLTFTGRTSTGITYVYVNGNLTVNGTLTVIPGTNATCRLMFYGFFPGTVMTCGAVSLTDVDFRNITAAGTAVPFSGTRIGNAGNNINITFATPKTVYWNLATGGNWSATAWATSGGGTPAVNNFPLGQDTVIFQSTGLNSGATVTVDNSWALGSVNLSARTTNTMTFSITYYNFPIISGNWIGGTGVTMTGTGFLNLCSGISITSAGVPFTQHLYMFNVNGDTVTLQDALTTTCDFDGNNSFILGPGTLNLNGKTLTLSGASSVFGMDVSSGVLLFNGGTLVIAGSGTSFTGGTYATTSAGTGTGTITMTSASAKTFAGAGMTFNCTLNQGGAGELTISGTNTFYNITNTYGSTGATSIIFPASTTTTVSNFTATGTVGKLLTINSSSAGSQATLSKSSGTVNASYLNIKDSAATGGAIWNAGTGSINSGNNTGWRFTNIGTFFVFF